MQLPDQCARVYSSALPPTMLCSKQAQASSSDHPLVGWAGQGLAGLGRDPLDAGSSRLSIVLEAAYFFTEKEYWVES